MIDCPSAEFVSDTSLLSTCYLRLLTPSRKTEENIYLLLVVRCCFYNSLIYVHPWGCLPFIRVIFYEPAHFFIHSPSYLDHWKKKNCQKYSSRQSMIYANPQLLRSFFLDFPDIYLYQRDFLIFIVSWDCLLICPWPTFLASIGRENRVKPSSK